MTLLALIYPLNFIISVANPRWGFIGLMMVILIRPPDRDPSLVGLPGYEILLAGILLGMALQYKDLPKPQVKQDVLIGWIFALSVAGLLIQASGELIDESKEFISSIIIYVFATRLIRNKSDLLTLLFWIALTTVGLAVEAMSSYLTDPNSRFTDPLSGRMQGLEYYGNPNEFAKLMCTALPFFAIFAFAGKGFFVRMTTLAGIVVMVVAVGLTQSRTCFVVLGIMVVTPFIVSNSQGFARRMIMIGILGIGLIYVVSFLPGPLQERTQSILQFSSDESFQGRTRAWTQGMQMVTWYPIYGVGKGQWSSYHGLAPHNSFVQVMAELGIPGIILFLSIVWASWRQLTTFVRERTENADRLMVAIGKGLAASYLGYLFYIFLGNQGYSPWTYFYFGICAAFANITSTPVEEKAQVTDDEVPADGLRA